MRKGLLIVGSMYFFLGCIYIFRSMLSGLGDVAFSVINGILEVAGRVGFASIFMFVLKMSYFGIWYTNVLTWFLIALSAISRFIYYIRQVEQGKVSIKI